MSSDRRLKSRRLADEIIGGLCGGLIAVAATLLLRSLVTSSLLAELVLDASTLTLKPGTFDRLLDALGPHGKQLLFASVVAAQLVVYTACWLLSSLSGDRVLRRVPIAIAAATGLLLLATWMLGPISGASMSPRGGWPLDVVVTIIVSTAGVAFAALITVAMSSVTGRPEVGHQGSRRRFLGVGASAAFSALAAVLIGRRIVASGDEGAYAGTKGLSTAEVTANKDFYVVTKNLIDPMVDVDKWRLRVGGSSQRLLELTYADVVARPSVQQYTTLQCVSNNVGGPLISNAMWEGFSLANLLDDVQPLSSARHVVFRCEDDYEESIPLEFARADGVLLAHRMNGEALPHKHGFPLRLLSPGKYGFKNPKWIKEIILMDQETDGYWELRYWSQEARMNTSSRIDVPSGGDHLSEVPVRVHGIAFSGNRGITRVEISTNSGGDWHEAVLQPALSPYTWVLWYYDWRPSGSGRTTLLARATDGMGEVQTAMEAFPHPSGATGYPHVAVILTPSA